VAVLKYRPASPFLHPIAISSIAWCSVAFLYSLHLSGLLQFKTSDAIGVALLIVLPVFFASFAYRLLGPTCRSSTRPTALNREPPLALIERRLRQGIWLWIGLALVETAVSGGVPLLWLLTGSSKIYFDYGIPSVHGMVIALMLAVAVTSLALYLYTENRWHIWFPLFAMVWSMILVSRGTLFILLLEYAIIYLRLRRITSKLAIRLVAITLVAVLLFGFVGDVRSGAEAFRDLAQPTDSFPDWAPSGLLWAYIYITTPVNNLLLTMHTRRPTYNPLLPDTAATLFPTVLRNVIYGKAGAAEAISGELETQALNVSTAYVGPYQDMGDFGIIGFSIIAALLCEFYWHRSGLWNIFAFSVFTQTLALSLFYNLLFSLPILGQLIWFYYFTRIPKASKSARPALRDLPFSFFKPHADPPAGAPE
jgi:oligosaccharide repeat unit polymerase